MSRVINITMTQTITVRQPAPDSLPLGPLSKPMLRTLQREAQAGADANDDPDVDMIGQHIVSAEVVEE